MPLNLAGNRVPISQGRAPSVDNQADFSGGLNTISAPDALQPNQFRRGDDGRLTPFGAFIKRGGTQQTAAALVSGHAILNAATWYKGDGSSQPLAVPSDGSIWGTTFGSFPLTWAKLTGGNAGALSTTVPPSFAGFISGTTTEAMYVADGGGLNKIVGSTLTTNLATTPNCRIICVHNQRLWGCGDPAFPDSIFYSDLNDGDSLGVGASGGGQIIVRTFGSLNITTLASVGTSLLIVHQGGISRLTGYGQDDVTVAPAGITSDVGSISPLAINVVTNSAFFISDRGLYQSNEQTVAPVATPQQPDPLTGVLPAMSSADIAAIRMAYDQARHELLIFVPNTGVYVYHTILRAWAGPWANGYLSPATTTLFETLNATGYPIVLRGDASGFISQCDPPMVVLDNVAADGTGGTTYVMALQPRRFYCQDPNTAKAWRYIYLLADLDGSNATNIQWSTNSTADSQNLPTTSSGETWGASDTTWGVGTWGAVAQTSYRIGADGNGYYIDVVISDSGQALPVFSQCGVTGFALGRR